MKVIYSASESKGLLAYMYTEILKGNLFNIKHLFVTNSEITLKCGNHFKKLKS